MKKFEVVTELHKNLPNSKVVVRYFLFPFTCHLAFIITHTGRSLIAEVLLQSSTTSIVASTVS